MTESLYTQLESYFKFLGKKVYAHNKLFNFVCRLAAPPEMVYSVFQPAQENRIAFNFGCL